MLSALRPRAAILAVAPNDAVANRLALWWGVTPLIYPGQDQREMEGWLRASGTIPADGVVVFINVTPDLNREDGNYVNVQQLV
jgi:pyruvate kinase